ncbi:MAG: hypothetical protein RXR52_30090, partial [Paraburkholderia sp.]
MSTPQPQGIETAAPPSRLERIVDARLWSSTPVVVCLTLFAIVILYFVFTVPLAFYEQLTFATCCFIC